MAPTLDDLREWWGGGVYEIRVHGPGPRGEASRILACRKVEIAGEPRPLSDDAPPTVEVPELLSRVLDQQYADKTRAEERLYQHQAQRRDDRAADPELVRATIDAVERSQRGQIEALRAQLDRRDDEIGELRRHVETERSRPSPFEHPDLLKLFFSRGSDDAARAVEQARHELREERDRHARELEAERTRHHDEVRVERERHDRELLAERERHDRELLAEHAQAKAERDRHEHALGIERQGRQQQVELIERLNRSDVDRAQVFHAQLLAEKDGQIQRLTDEVRTLRAAAHPPDALSDLERMGKVVSTVRELVPSLGGTTEAEPTSTWERVASAWLERAAERVMRPEPVQVIQAPPPPQLYSVPMPLPVQHVPQRRNVTTRRPPQGPYAPPASAVQRAPAKPAEPTVQAPPPPAAPPASAAPAVMEGLEFLEAAFQDGRPVADVAASAVALFPRAAVTALVNDGPARLVAEIEQRAPDSLLVSPGGRHYLGDLVDAVRAKLAEAQ